jgi:colanic acid biosynthesis glycosyl transferase WcaI
LGYRTVIASCVGGGPMERLAARLRERGVAAEVLAGQTPEGWRALMGGGIAGRVRARLGAYLTFPARVVAAAFTEDAVFVPTTNPFILPVVLVATRRLHRRPVVPLIYDLYPDALEASGVAADSGVVSRLAAAANRYLFAGADAVVFIGGRMAEHAQARYGRARRSAILETGADAQELEPAGLRGPPESELERWCEGRYVLSYVGNLGRVHDWQTLQDGVPRLLGLAGERPVGVVVSATGPGVDVLRKAWRALPAEAVRFEPPLPDRAWARLLARSDVSIATLREAAKRTSIPSKAFSALAAGSALLAVAPADSDLAELVRRYAVGGVVEPGDVPGFVRAVERLAPWTGEGRTARERARAAAVERFDVGRLAERWDLLLAEVNASIWRGRQPSKS